MTLHRLLGQPYAVAVPEDVYAMSSAMHDGLVESHICGHRVTWRDHECPTDCCNPECHDAEARRVLDALRDRGWRLTR